MATNANSDAVEESPKSRRDLTKLQRERVRELIGRSDRRIAKRLITEKLFVAPDGAENDPELQRRFEAACRRTVCNHRKAIRDGWKTEPPAELGDPVATQEFIARLMSRLDDLDEILERSDLKPTAKVNALAEIRQIEIAVAKAKGVDIDWKRFGKTDDPDDESQSKLPFVGLLVDLKNCSPEVRAEIEREQHQGGRRSRGAAEAAADPKVQVQR